MRNGGKMDTLDIIKSSKIIAISRGNYGERLLNAAEALRRGGVRAFEVTFEQDGDIVRTYEAVVRLAENLPSDCVVGVGTVMSQDQVEMAYRAGAKFIISPNTDPEVIAKTKQLGLVSIPGAMTPSEIAFAYSLGADIVKVFPAGVLGIEYFKAVRAPLKHIPMAAVAGIDVNNIAAFNRAGAAAFGISSSLFKKEAISKGDWHEIENAALAFYAALERR